MCGILGSFNNKPIDRGLFNKQLDAISHRGPDDRGTWFREDGCIGLGSRRLAILDISSNGHMPMISDDENFILVFNGEIYNYLELKNNLINLGFKFKSNSDSECVLNAYIAWGKDFLDRLNGMFSIAIYDKLSNIFFLARDRAGEKPLYYWKHDNGFSFSSELKQLLLNQELPRNLNIIAVKQFLEDGFVKGRESFIENVFKLPPAHYMIFNINDSSCKLFKYWEVPSYEPNNLSNSELIDKLDSLLSDAVKRQMISDVPLGVLLSGGVDSSLLTSYAAENSRNLKTFHISFNGFGKFDESIYARKVADYFNTDHIELNGNEIKFDMIDDLLEYFDEPLGDSSMLPTYLVSKLTRNHVTVALGGDGGDELFGGYTSYLDLLHNNTYIDWTPQFIKKVFSNIGSKLPIGLRGRNFLINSVGNHYERFLHNRLFDEFSLKNVLSKEYYNKLETLNSKNEIQITRDLIYDITKYDFQNYLSDDILVKVDRTSMASSLELRAPFLDKNVIEFAFSSVSSNLKVNDDKMKILLKELLQKRMPIDFNLNRKQGFSIPLNDWIADKWHINILSEINSLPDIFNKNIILQMCINVKKGFSNSSKLYAIIILNKWLKKYKINY